MEDFIPALIILVVGTPISILFYRCYTERWYRKHGRAEDVFTKGWDCETECLYPDDSNCDRCVLNP